MRAKAFCPGHITGFFEICDRSADPLDRGSRGAGVSIARGVTTEVIVQESGAPKLEVSINGRPDPAPVTKSAVSFISKLSKDLSQLRVTINHNADMPIGCGMGSSGAGAWGVSLALNEILKLGLTQDRVGQIAHKAEIENRTGLGTVIAQQKGGIEIRSAPGGPGIGRVDQIPFPDDLRVICSSKGAISTRSMLEDSRIRARINRFGGKLVKRIESRASYEEFMHLSRRFSEQTQLLSRDLQTVLKLLDERGFHNCSMALFGETIFSLARINEAEGIMQILNEWNKQGETFCTEIDPIGARLLSGERNG